MKLVERGLRSGRTTQRCCVGSWPEPWRRSRNPV